MRRFSSPEMVRHFDALGFQVCIHAQGDRAIETVLEAYAAILASAAGNPRRHRIEHGGAMYPPLTDRAAALGIVVVSQPGFLSVLGDGFPDRRDQLYSFASWQQAGITVAGSRLRCAGQEPARGGPVQIADIQVLATVLDATPVWPSAGIFPEG
ncbi:MAG: amidohydrolase family protein [Streptosporangiaceae bacterium]